MSVSSPVGVGAGLGPAAGAGRVSAQAARLTREAPGIAVAHFRAEADPYHPEGNPGGYLNLGTAENRLVWDLLAPRFTGTRRVDAADTYYAQLHGTPAVRRAVAGVLSRACRTTVAADDLVVVSGATAALDIIASVLCDPGEAIIAPAPYYGAFDTDLTGRSGARLVAAPLRSDDGFRLRPEALERVLVDARRTGEVVVRAIVLSSPYNPVGHVYDAPTLRAILSLAADHDLDVIADEIYAHSVFGPAPFVSMLDPAVDTGARTHLIWGLSKDFGLPGLKVGVLHTRDPEVAAAARALAYFAPVSTDTQALVSDLLSDDGWTTELIAESQRRLAASYAHVAAVLDAHRIPYLPAEGGFSVWLDLRGWLGRLTPAGKHPDFAAEDGLWRHIFDTTRVNILPGGIFACPEPGWFRLCHTTDPRTVQEAVDRIARSLEQAGGHSP